MHFSGKKAKALLNMIMLKIRPVNIPVRLNSVMGLSPLSRATIQALGAHNNNE